MRRSAALQLLLFCGSAAGDSVATAPSANVSVRTAIKDAQLVLCVYASGDACTVNTDRRDYCMVYSGLSLVFDLAVGPLTACRSQQCF